ncbi:MAG: hypothetical protein U1E65_12190 [Myxococcota bacterium]
MGRSVRALVLLGWIALGGCLRASDTKPRQDTTKADLFSAAELERMGAKARLLARQRELEDIVAALEKEAAGTDPARAAQAIGLLVELGGAPFEALLAGPAQDAAISASPAPVVSALLRATASAVPGVSGRATRLLTARGLLRTAELSAIPELDRIRCQDAAVVIRSPSGQWTEDDSLVFVETAAGAIFVDAGARAAQRFASTATKAQSACDKGFGVQGKDKTLTVVMLEDHRPDRPRAWAFSVSLDPLRVVAPRRPLGPVDEREGVSPAPGGFSLRSDPGHEPRGGCHDKCNLDRWGRRYHVERLVEGSLPAVLKVEVPALTISLDVERTVREAHLELRLLFPDPSELARVFRLDPKDPTRRLSEYALISLDDGSRCFWVDRDMSWPDDAEVWPCKRAGPIQKR